MISRDTCCAHSGHPEPATMLRCDGCQTLLGCDRCGYDAEDAYLFVGGEVRCGRCALATVQRADVPALLKAGAAA